MKTAVITLAVHNDRYRNCADSLEKSLKTYNSEYDFFVYSDCPERLSKENYYQIKEVTDIGVTSVTVNVFNYNLKALIFNHFYKTHAEYEKVVFLDADAFFVKRNNFIKEFTNEFDFYYINNSNYNYKSLVGQQKDKFEKLITRLGLDNNYFDKLLRRGNETVFIANRSNKMNDFLNTWADISKKSVEAKISAIYEFMEISIAIDMHPEITVGNLSFATTEKDDSIKLFHKNSTINLIRR